METVDPLVRDWLEETRGPHPRASPGTADFELSVLFDRVLDAVVVADLPDCRITLWNPAAQRLFGYTAEEAIGQSVEIVMPPAIAEVHRAGLARYLRTGRGLMMDATAPVEVPARTRAGDDIRVEVALSVLRSRDGRPFALAIMRDAMARKRLELLQLELDRAQVARARAEADLAAALSNRDGQAAAPSGGHER